MSPLLPSTVVHVVVWALALVVGTVVLLLPTTTVTAVALARLRLRLAAYRLALVVVRYGGRALCAVIRFELDVIEAALWLLLAAHRALIHVRGAPRLLVARLRHRHHRGPPRRSRVRPGVGVDQPAGAGRYRGEGGLGRRDLPPVAHRRQPGDQDGLRARPAPLHRVGPAQRPRHTGADHPDDAPLLPGRAVRGHRPAPGPDGPAAPPPGPALADPPRQHPAPLLPLGRPHRAGADRPDARPLGPPGRLPAAAGPAPRAGRRHGDGTGPRRPGRPEVPRPRRRRHRAAVRQRPAGVGAVRAAPGRPRPGPGPGDGDGQGLQGARGPGQRARGRGGAPVAAAPGRADRLHADRRPVRQPPGQAAHAARRPPDPRHEGGQPDAPPRPAAQLRHAPPRRWRRPPSGPGAPGPRRPADDAGVHPRQQGATPERPHRDAPPGLTGRADPARRTHPWRRTVLLALLALLAGLAAALAPGGPGAPRAAAHVRLAEQAPDPDGPVDYAPPVDAPVSDPFRPPPQPWLPGNRGIEYATAPGTPVRAAGRGRVTFAGSVAGSLHVTITHPDGVRTSYSYLATLAVGAGTTVERGHVVGTTGPRLHVGARRGDSYIDPASLWAASGPPWVRLAPLDDAAPRGTGGRVARAPPWRRVGGVRGVAT